MEWMLLPYKRYADFSGRSRRQEYWMFFLFQMLAPITILIASALLGLVFGMVLGETVGQIFGYLGLAAIVVLSLGSIVPGIAVAVRRMHDLDKSGWALLFGLIPLVGGIILLVWYCTEGTRGANRFGPDPKDPNSVSAFT